MSKSLIPTMQLRFESREVVVPYTAFNGMTYSTTAHILQQAFTDPVTNKTVWVDIPTVVKETA